MKLRATRCGARWLIAPEDLSAFFAALAGETNCPPADAVKKVVIQKLERRAAKAAAELGRRGA